LHIVRFWVSFRQSEAVMMKKVEEEEEEEKEGNAPFWRKNKSNRSRLLSLSLFVLDDVTQKRRLFSPSPPSPSASDVLTSSTFVACFSLSSQKGNEISSLSNAARKRGLLRLCHVFLPVNEGRSKPKPQFLNDFRPEGEKMSSPSSISFSQKI